MLLCMMLKKVIKMTIAQGLGHTFLAVISGLGITPITTPPPLYAPGKDIGSIEKRKKPYNYINQAEVKRLFPLNI